MMILQNLTWYANYALKKHSLKGYINPYLRNLAEDVTYYQISQLLFYFTHNPSYHILTTPKTANYIYHIRLMP